MEKWEWNGKNEVIIPDSSRGRVLLQVPEEHGPRIAACQEMHEALRIVERVLRDRTISGTDNNPYGVRDLIGAALSKASGRRHA